MIASLNHVIIPSDTVSQVEKLECVLKMIQSLDLTLRLSKCVVLAPNIKFFSAANGIVSRLRSNRDYEFKRNGLFGIVKGHPKLTRIFERVDYIFWSTSN